MDIISATQTTVEQAQAWARSKGASEAFIAIAAFYWAQATAIGINPEGAYCQAAHETGYGNFGGTDKQFSATAAMHNLCGLKSHDGSVTQSFYCWEDGIAAHLDHLALYAGVDGYPKSNSLDPRQFASIKSLAKTFLALGTHWAPDPDYGKYIEELAVGLRAYRSDASKLKEIGLIINS